MSSTLWKQCLSRLETSLNEEDVIAWLRSLSARENGTNLVLNAPNRYAKEKIESDYLPMIAENVEFLTGREYDVSVCLAGGRRNSPKATRDATNRNSNSNNRLGSFSIDRQPYGFEVLNRNYTFDEHVVGESNQLARHMAQHVAGVPGEREHNPLFIYGDVGNGKTHLMQASGHQMRANFPGKKIGYVRANNFVRHLVTLMKRKDSENIEQFKTFYQELDALLIDDIHHFAGADVSQQEFLHTFNTLLEGNKQIIITSDRFFKEINGVEDRLKSRLGQGFTIRVKPPELETRIAILESKAEKRGVELDPEVSRFVAEKINSSVRELEGALNQLIASYNFTNEPISIASAKKILYDTLEFHSRPIDIPTILKEVARFYRIRVDDILSSSRRANIARARHVSMVLARQLTSQSLPRIAEAIGGKNHSTVIHACKRVNALIEEDSEFRSEFNTLKDMLSH